ncbi:MAG: 2Fe-2S iron-sulfur cluster-binding protein [Bacteroidales bacterium]
MIKIKIDGMPVEAPEQSRLIDIIRNEGIDVPSLCYKPGMEHYTSCMACMVRENNSGKYIPSCSVIVSEDMDIDASGPEVIRMRAEAIRLLLVEHRAECEAPCRLVCPLKLDIPLMNRLLIAGDVAGATALAFNTLGDPVTVCTACKGYCDKACRRKKIDTGISIKSTVIFLGSRYRVPGAGSQVAGIGSENQQPKTRTETGESRASSRPKGVNQQPETSNQQPESSSRPKEVSPVPDTRYPIPPFNSTLGAVTDDEFREWLKEAAPDAAAHPNPSTESEAVEEASRCLHCDCRATTDCRLRDAATSLSVKNPRGKHTAYPIEKKINPVSGLIFEHAKCIKCGLCVRLGEKLTGQPSLCFRGRGYETIITEPLYHEFVDILNDAAREFAEICPTGALTLKE